MTSEHTPRLPFDVICTILEPADLETRKKMSLLSHDVQHVADNLLWKRFQLCVTDSPGVPAHPDATPVILSRGSMMRELKFVTTVATHHDSWEDKESMESEALLSALKVVQKLPRLDKLDLSVQTSEVGGQSWMLEKFCETEFSCRLRHLGIRLPHQSNYRTPEAINGLWKHHPHLSSVNLDFPYDGRRGLLEPSNLPTLVRLHVADWEALVVGSGSPVEELCITNACNLGQRSLDRFISTLEGFASTLTDLTICLRDWGDHYRTLLSILYGRFPQLTRLMIDARAATNWRCVAYLLDEAHSDAIIHALARTAKKSMLRELYISGAGHDDARAFAVECMDALPLLNVVSLDEIDELEYEMAQPPVRKTFEREELAHLLSKP